MIFILFVCLFVGCAPPASQASRPGAPGHVSKGHGIFRIACWSYFGADLLRATPHVLGEPARRSSSSSQSSSPPFSVPASPANGHRCAFPQSPRFRHIRQDVVGNRRMCCDVAVHRIPCVTSRYTGLTSKPDGAFFVPSPTTPKSVFQRARDGAHISKSLRTKGTSQSVSVPLSSRRI